MKILSIFGTRPEAIKMAPLVKMLANDPYFSSSVCVTAQHREMLDQVLEIFNIQPKYDLNLMTKNQSLSQLTSKMISKITDVLEKDQPDMVLVHGDTATTFAAALSAFYKQIKIGHVEAGLRTGNLSSPWPEEANRRLTGVLTDMHFCPTETSKRNLILENVSSEKIFITGNTVIDSLLMIKSLINGDSSMQNSFFKKFGYLDPKKKLILVTGHRRENFGTGFINICKSLRNLAISNPNTQIVYPVHLNPSVQKPVKELLSSIENIFLIEPLDYLPFVYLMDRSYLILTDSGGIQEEAPSLGKPVLVMRNTSERPEAIKAGTAKLVGTDSIKIEKEVQSLINNKDLYHQMCHSHNPYGDGDSCSKIIKLLKETETS